MPMQKSLPNISANYTTPRTAYEDEKPSASIKMFSVPANVCSEISGCSEIIRTGIENIDALSNQFFILATTQQ